MRPGAGAAPGRRRAAGSSFSRAAIRPCCSTPRPKRGGAARPAARRRTTVPSGAERSTRPSRVRRIQVSPPVTTDLASRLFPARGIELLAAAGNTTRQVEPGCNTLTSVTSMNHSPRSTAYEEDHRFHPRPRRTSSMTSSRLHLERRVPSSTDRSATLSLKRQRVRVIQLSSPDVPSAQFNWFPSGAGDGRCRDTAPSDHAAEAGREVANITRLLDARCSALRRNAEVILQRIHGSGDRTCAVSDQGRSCHARESRRRRRTLAEARRIRQQLGLPDRDYYLRKIPSSKSIVPSTWRISSRCCRWAACRGAGDKARGIMEFETALAEVANGRWRSVATPKRTTTRAPRSNCWLMRRASTGRRSSTAVRGRRA